MISGVELIREERKRQITVEGWTSSNDVAYTEGELAVAAACYALPKRIREMHSTELNVGENIKKIPNLWPWEAKFWKPSEFRLRELVKAGALIAAEIDRINHANFQSKK